jgi:hypothetical protein
MQRRLARSSAAQILVHLDCSCSACLGVLLLAPGVVGGSASGAQRNQLGADGLSADDAMGDSTRTANGSRCLELEQPLRRVA